MITPTPMAALLLEGLDGGLEDPAVLLEGGHRTLPLPATLGDAQKAMSAAQEAGTMLTDAFDADEEATRLEELAEAALAASETAIEQHLIDFPDSELADEV